jgi:hypothetical protein
MADRHNTDPSLNLHSASGDHARLPSRPIARLPPAAEPGEDILSQKPSLPPLSKFLSDARCPDLCAPNPTQHRRADSPSTAGAVPYDHRAAPPADYKSSEQKSPSPSESYSSRFWHYLSSSQSRAHSEAVSTQYPVECSPMPRSPREELIPGHGLCYVYEDGTTIQKTIDGDIVNPKWGTTKAGNPRKRLGQACNRCREKKIKCDPSVSKCTQCQKVGRECKFDSTYAMCFLFCFALMLVLS